MSVLKVTSPGTVVMKATIPGGSQQGGNYTQNFSITFVPNVVPKGLSGENIKFITGTGIIQNYPNQNSSEPPLVPERISNKPDIEAVLSSDGKSYTITIDYKDYTIKEYRTGKDIYFQTYTGPFTIDTNTTIYARGSTETAQGEVANYCCCQIYVPQPIITESLNISKTQSNITINYNGISQKLYKTNDDVNWKTYTSTFSVLKNTEIYAKAIDTDGNESFVSFFTVDQLPI